MIVIKKIISVLLSALLIFACSEKPKTSKTDANIFIDDKGYEVKIDGIPQKIISLAPSLTEAIYSLGADKYLVGNTQYCDYPEAAKSVTKVGDMLKTDFEKILQLNPDLIFVSMEGTTKEAYDRLIELGFTVYISNPRDFAGIKKSYTNLSKIFHLEEKAVLDTAAWNIVVDSIKTKAKQFKGISAMFLVSADPLMVAGKNTFINKYLKDCSITNIAEDLPQNYPILSREEVLDKNPDYIFVANDHGLNPDNIKNLYPEWINITAIKENNIIVIDPNLFYRPGPRFPVALTTLYESIKKLKD